MRNQTTAILSDIDEDNFDRAFDILRPGEIFLRAALSMLLVLMEHLSPDGVSGCKQDIDAG
jgi:hypothetical protein